MANQLTTNRRWQDWVTLVLGIWLFFSPWIFSFQSVMPAASWNFYVLGIAFFVFAVAALNMRTLWEEWVTLVLGIWMIVSPWVLAYTEHAEARNDAVIVGIIIGVMSIWALARKHAPAGEIGMDHEVVHR